MASCQKGPSRHAYEWQVGPFWQDTLEMSHIVEMHPSTNTRVIYFCMFLDKKLIIYDIQFQEMKGIWPPTSFSFSNKLYMIAYCFNRTFSLTQMSVCFVGILYDILFKWLSAVANGLDTLQSCIKPSIGVFSGSVWSCYSQ